MTISVSGSRLVKTAIAGSDANWGRVVMAVGKSGEAADLIAESRPRPLSLSTTLLIRFGETTGREQKHPGKAATFPPRGRMQEAIWPDAA